MKKKQPKPAPHAAHTQGTLRVIGKDSLALVTENWPKDSIAGFVASVQAQDAPGQTRANAERLKACWNACAGIPTEALEGAKVVDRLAEALAYLTPRKGFADADGAVFVLRAILAKFAGK